jgi:hypothetical protein
VDIAGSICRRFFTRDESETSQRKREIETQLSLSTKELEDLVKIKEKSSVSAIRKTRNLVSSLSME